MVLLVPPVWGDVALSQALPRVTVPNPPLSHRSMCWKGGRDSNQPVEVLVKRSQIRRKTPIRGGLSLRGLKELDDLSRTFTMMRAGAALVTDEGRKQWWGSCQRCSKTDWLSWCHIFTRAARSVRWDQDNSWAWCRGCHRFMDQHWEQKRDWVIAKIGQHDFDLLKLRSNGRRVDISGVRMELKQRIARVT